MRERQTIHVFEIMNTTPPALHSSNLITLANNYNKYGFNPAIFINESEKSFGFTMAGRG